MQSVTHSTTSRHRSSTPTFSVVIPTYNRADVLPRAIRSVLSQTHTDLELIVVDDGSTDETLDVVRCFDDPRVDLHRFPDQRGANAARNAGVDLARGEFVSFLDSDDEFHPEHLERVLAAFHSAGSGCDGVFTACRFKRNGQVVRESSVREGKVSYDELRSDNVVGVFSCVTFRATVFEYVRLDEDLKCWQDYDFFLRVSRRGHTICGIGENLVILHQADTRIGTNLDRTLQGTRRFLEKHRDELTNRGISKAHYYRAFRLAHSGQLGSARREFLRSIRSDPSRWTAYLHLIAALHSATFRLLLEAKRVFRLLRRRLV